MSRVTAVLAASAAEEDAYMRGYTLSTSTARELSSAFSDEADSVKLVTEEGRTIGVLLSPEEHQLLRAAADLASEPERLFELLRENDRFQAGDEGDILTTDEFNSIFR